MKPILLLIITTLTPVVITLQSAENFNIEEISENQKPMPFSITRVEQQTGEIRLWIESSKIAEVSKLLRGGVLQAQSSKGESSITVPLSLWKAVDCKNRGTFHLGYSEPLPNYKIERIRYYFRVPVTLGQGRELAIGIDPDFLWLIEKK